MMVNIMEPGDAMKQFRTMTIPTREQLDILREEVMKLPQIEPKTDHYFSGGMYCRRVWRAAGSLIIGKTHKVDHFFMCASGEIIVLTDRGRVLLKAGDVVESKAGVQRVTYALVDSIGITVHKTDLTELDAIEAELIEPEPSALFDSGNNLKTRVLQ